MAILMDSECSREYDFDLNILAPCQAPYEHGPMLQRLCGSSLGELRPNQR